jgi:hypothetical protein
MAGITITLVIPITVVHTVYEQIGSFREILDLMMSMGTENR